VTRQVEKKRRLLRVGILSVNYRNQTILKTRTKIIIAFSQHEPIIKQFWKCERSDVDEASLKWFKQERSYNVPVSGPLLTIIFVHPKLPF